MGGRAPLVADEPEGPHRRRQPTAGVAGFPRGPPPAARGCHRRAYAPRPRLHRRGDPGRPADSRASLGPSHGRRAPARQGGAGDRLGRADRAGAGASGPRSRGRRLRPALRRRVARPPRPRAASARGRPLRDLQPGAGRRADAGPRHRARLVPRPRRTCARSISSLRTPPATRPWWCGPCSRAWRGPSSSWRACPSNAGTDEVGWPTIDLPGLEQFGGPRAAAALAGPGAALALQQHRGAQPFVGRVRLRARRRRFDAANGPAKSPPPTPSCAGSIAASDDAPFT